MFGSWLTGSSRKATMPKMRMPVITSTVMTGRRTKISEMFTPGSSRGGGRVQDVHLDAGCEAQRAAHHDLVALANRAVSEHRGFPFGACNDDLANLRRQVGLHHVDELAGGAGWHGARRDQDGVFLVEQLDAHRIELPRPERGVAVVENRAHLDGARGLGDRVFEEGEASPG